MKISIIAGIGRNSELGRGNTLLWSLPTDMKHFKKTTTGHTVIMGRKTFESIGRPLPNRKNIVITRDVHYSHDGVEIVNSLEEALRLASLEQGRKFEENQDEVEIFIIGGGEIYRQAMEKANKLYITRVDGEFDADTFFPAIDSNIWVKTKSERYTKDEQDAFDFEFIEYERK